MSEVPVPVESDSLEDKIEEALDIDAQFKGPDGEEMEMPESVLSSIRTQNVADAIAEHVSEISVQHDLVESTTLDYGSGDTGRQSKLNLHPSESVKKTEIREMAKKLDIILDEIFPVEYLIGIQHEFTVDQGGYPVETSDYSLFLAYQVRSHGSPSKPPGESTELI